MAQHAHVAIDGESGSGRIKQRQVKTTMRASLKREYHYLTIHLPVIKIEPSLSFRANSYLLFDSPSAAPAPLPSSATLFIEPQILDVYFSDSSDLHSTREGSYVCFVPTALFPPSFTRQPAPKQSKTRDVGTENGAGASRSRSLARRRIQIFTPPEPPLSECRECPHTPYKPGAVRHVPLLPHFHLCVQFHHHRYCLPNRIHLVFHTPPLLLWHRLLLLLRLRRFCSSSTFLSCISSSWARAPAAASLVDSEPSTKRGKEILPSRRETAGMQTNAQGRGQLRARLLTTQ